MQSSAAVAGRALIMLACVVGIPILALSGASWSEILKKIEDFRWPAIVNPASASPSATSNEAPRLAQAHPPVAPAASVQSAVVSAGHQESASILPSVVSAAGASSPGAAVSAADSFGSVQDRLRQFGATYYLLESWGAERQMYRFYCKMAVGGSAEYVRCFEATNAEPLQAMLQVLRQVEAWKEGGTAELGTRN
jgi:hypothetical protein